MAQQTVERLEVARQSGDIAQRIGDITLTLAKVTMDFSKIERVPRYDDGHRETDVEHSYMLSLVAPEISVALGLNLNTGLIAEFAKVHDLIELKTGDVNTFNATPEQLAQKQFNEKQALHQLMAELPPHTAGLLERYETQREPEARLVKAVDKILPFAVDILGDGLRIMKENNRVETRTAFLRCLEELHAGLVERFGHEFPEVMEAHQILGGLFSDHFPELPEQDYLFDLP